MSTTAGAQGGSDDPFGLLAGLDLSTVPDGFFAGKWPAELGTTWRPAELSVAWRPAGLAAAGADAAADAAADAGMAGAGMAGAYTCAQCGAQLRRGLNDLEYICSGCGLIVEGDTAEPEEDGAPRAAPNAARLRIVGPNSNQLQPDLYRSSMGSTAASQKKQIYEEYCAFRALYIEAGGRAIPLDACSLASDYYNEVQRLYVKRSLNKKEIMAAFLYNACITIGFSPSKAEVAAFMQLPNKGIARGENFVRSLVADGKMDVNVNVNVNVDPCRPEIRTLFAFLGFEDPAYDHLRAAVYDVVQAAIANNIGTSSVLRSKVAGATFAVLHRCTDRGLIARPIGLQEFCLNRIRKNTVERFTRELESYHSYFAPCYTRAGLNSAPHR